MEDKIKLIHLLDARADRLLYTYRTQEKAADRYAFWERWRKRISIGLTVVTTGTLITSIVCLMLNEIWGNFVAALIATLATGASFSGEFFEFKAKIAEHQKSAVKIRYLFERYESLISDLEVSAISDEDARKIRDELELKEQDVLSTAPRTTSRDYNNASIAINGNEKPQSSQEEIDNRTPGRM